MGLSVSALFRWENGERIPRGERAVAWAEFLEQLVAAGGHRDSATVPGRDPRAAADDRSADPRPGPRVSVSR